MSTLVLEDIGASTPGSPLRLRFDNSGNTDVVFDVDDVGLLIIRPDRSRILLQEPAATGSSGCRWRVYTTGTPFIATDVNISPTVVGAIIGPLSDGQYLGAGVHSNVPLIARTQPADTSTTITGLHAGTAGTRRILRLDFTDASAPNDEVSRFIECEDSTSTKMQVWSNGDIENAQNNYGGISDESLKQDIVDADPQSQWDDLKAMRFRKWRFKTDVAAKGDDARTCLGAVGQEMQAVSPGLVRTSTKRRVVTESILEEGETSYKVEHFDDGPPLLSISYSVLYMKGMVALQEAMRRIEALEAR